MINLLQHVITQVYSTKKGIYQGEQALWRVGSTGLTACWPTFRYNYPSIYLPSIHTCCLCNLSIILSTGITPQQASQASQYHLHSSLINSPSFIWNMSICSTDQKSLYTTKAAVKVKVQEALLQSLQENRHDFVDMQHARNKEKNLLFSFLCILYFLLLFSSHLPTAHVLHPNYQGSGSGGVRQLRNSYL